MKKRSVFFAAASVLFLLGATAGSALATGAAPDILFYGNSFTNNVNVPGIFSKVVAASGQAQTPNVVNAAVNSMDLSFHIAVQTSNVAVSPNTTVNHWINDNALNNNASGSWDYVVMQEYSTKPTNIAYGSAGNPTQFKNDAQTLFNLVKADSAGVKPILYETWSRQPNNQADLSHFYPALTAYGTGALPYTAAANQMQSELHQYYYEAKNQKLGGAACGLAPVGDAFQQMGFDTSLYQSDLYHESNKGGLMAALLIYEQVYQSGVGSISYATMNSKLSGGLANYGINDAATWTTFATLADTMTAGVPEPTAAGVLVFGAGLLLRRRHQAMRPGSAK